MFSNTSPKQDHQILEFNIENFLNNKNNFLVLQERIKKFLVLIPKILGEQVTLMEEYKELIILNNFIQREMIKLDKISQDLFNPIYLDFLNISLQKLEKFKNDFHTYQSSLYAKLTDSHHPTRVQEKFQSNIENWITNQIELEALHVGIKKFLTQIRKANGDRITLIEEYEEIITLNNFIHRELIKLNKLAQNFFNPIHQQFLNSSLQNCQRFKCDFEIYKNLFYEKLIIQNFQIKNYHSTKAIEPPQDFSNSTNVQEPEMFNPENFYPPIGRGEILDFNMEEAPKNNTVLQNPSFWQKVKRKTKKYLNHDSNDNIKAMLSR